MKIFYFFLAFTYFTQVVQGIECPPESLKVEYEATSGNKITACQKKENGQWIKHGAYLEVSVDGKIITKKNYDNGKIVELKKETDIKEGPELFLRIFSGHDAFCASTDKNDIWCWIKNEQDQYLKQRVLINHDVHNLTASFNNILKVFTLNFTLNSHPDLIFSLKMDKNLNPTAPVQKIVPSKYFPNVNIVDATLYGNGESFCIIDFKESVGSTLLCSNPKLPPSDSSRRELFLGPQKAEFLGMPDLFLSDSITLKHGNEVIYLDRLFNENRAWDRKDDQFKYIRIKPKSQINSFYSRNDFVVIFDDSGNLYHCGRVGRNFPGVKSILESPDAKAKRCQTPIEELKGATAFSYQDYICTVLKEKTFCTSSSVNGNAKPGQNGLVLTAVDTPPLLAMATMTTTRNIDVCGITKNKKSIYCFNPKTTQGEVVLNLN